MRLNRQDYLDSSYDTAKAAGCDTLQLKYDGWWCRCEITNGQVRCYSETNRELEHFRQQLPTPVTLTLVGELMWGTQWSKDPARYEKLYLYDIWQHEDRPLELLPYKERFILLRHLLPSLPPSFQLIQNFRIFDYSEVWSSFVESERFEGVVFRNSLATVGQPLHRAKFTFTVDLQVRGFKEGNGKHQNRLGSLLCIDSDGILTEVGGGIDDITREEVWTNQDSYLMRYCQVEARKKFLSGSLRHPNFISWRPEGWQPKP